MTKPNEQIHNLKPTLLKAMRDFLDKWQQLKATDGSSFNPLEIVSTSFGNLTLKEVYERVGYYAEIISSLDFVKPNMLIPLGVLNELFKSMQAVYQEIQNLSNIVNITSIQGLTTQSTSQGGANHNGTLSNLIVNLDSVGRQYIAIAPILNSPKLKALPHSYSSILNRDNQAGKLLVLMDKNQKEVHAIKDRISAVDLEISKIKEASQSKLNDTESFRSTSEQKLSVINTNFAQMESIFTQAGVLKQRVQEYQVSFDAFNTNLQARNEEYNKLKSNLLELENSFNESTQKALATFKAEQEAVKQEMEGFTSEIARLTQEADKMLSGATVAGLATGFGDAVKKMTTQLNWSAGLFACSLGLLVSFCALQRDWLFGGNHDTAFLIQKAIYLSPFFMLIWFLNRRHNLFFRLREHYNYKYSIAMSVEGFKRQSPKHAEDIAAKAFAQLTDNPADKMEAKQDGESPSVGLLSEIFNRLLPNYGKN